MVRQGQTLRALLSLSFFLVLLGRPPGAAADAIRLEGMLIVRPRSAPCDGKLTRVTTLYRVVRVLRGKLADATVLVVHRCPDIPRGPSRYGRGDAGALGPGQIHILDLEPIDEIGAVQGLIDPFTDDRRPRYRAERTNRGDHPPRIVVVIRGGAGTAYRLKFDARTVEVGRSSGADVMLSDSAVAPRHLRLQVVGDALEVTDLGSATGTLLNQRRLDQPRPITYRDRIQVGPNYELQASLLLLPGS